MTTAIKLQTLKWSNWFSYGDNNVISFENEIITQIKGKNGSGKSSIPLIIEEVLYGKNSKGVKKADLINRYIEQEAAIAELKFLQGESEYIVNIKRNKGSASVKLSLIADGVDISSHTSSATYKTIENIIGLDFKVFSQLIYQSSKSSLQFLEATDTQRKEFLILLFGLSIYTKYYEIFKKQSREITNELNTLNGAIATVTDWIKGHEETKEKLNLLVVPEIPSSLQTRLVNLENTLSSLTQKNNIISKNNTYKDMLRGIDQNILANPVIKPTTNLTNLNIEKGKLTSLITQHETTIKKLDKLPENICPTCLQDINQEKMNDLYTSAEFGKKIHNIDLNVVLEKIKTHNTQNNAYFRSKKNIEEFEALITRIDNNLANELYDKEELLKEKNEIVSKLDKFNKECKLIISANEQTIKINNRIDLIEEQRAKYIEELHIKKSKHIELTHMSGSLDILKKVFSTSGIINYKIEYLVKDLENSINSYLSELSEGKFQLKFTLVGEKINIVIIDNGNKVTVDALSAGELSRVNISTLLAIRKLMSGISNTHINILFLDEIMGVLDEEGRDKLIAVLSTEQELNTFLVSHEWEHPLVPQINIIKKGRISMVDNG